jgi:hypothetical protein
VGIQVDGTFLIEGADTVSTAAEAFGHSGQWAELANANLAILLEGREQPTQDVGSGLLLIAASQVRPGMILSQPPEWAPPPPAPPARSTSKSGA